MASAKARVREEHERPLSRGGAPGDFILAVFDVMARAKWHTFQVLTKRADRFARLATRAEAEEEQPDVRNDRRTLFALN